jgi:uncharacterized protein
MNGPNRWFGAWLRGSSPGLFQSTVSEFGGVLTNARRFIAPSSPIQLEAQVLAWRSSPMCLILGETPMVVDRWLRLLARSGVSGPAVHDARIAASCLVAGVDELWTCDRDYARFPELLTRNLLVTPS